MKRKGTILALKGVYRIIVTTPSKTYTYYGRTIKSFGQRFTNHLYDLKRGKHANRFMQNLFNKHGAECFLFEPMCVCRNNAKAVLIEQALLDKFYGNDSCINLSRISEGGGVPNKRNKSMKYHNLSRSYMHESGLIEIFEGAYTTRDILDKLHIETYGLAPDIRNGFVYALRSRAKLNGWTLGYVSARDELHKHWTKLNSANRTRSNVKRRNDLLSAGGIIRSAGRPKELDDMRVKRLIKESIDYFNNVWKERPSTRNIASFVSELEGIEISRESIRKYMKDLGYYSDTK